MKRYLLGAAVALMAFVAPAAAADLGGYKDSGSYTPAGATWTGVYGALSAGVSASVTELSADAWGDGRSFNWVNLDGIGGQGFVGSAEIGARYQMGRFVSGVFADYELSSIKSTASTDFGGGMSADLKLRDAWTVGGKAGVLTSPDTLLYVLVGYTQAHGKISGFGDEVDSSPDFSGWMVGGGAETRLTHNLSLRGEYRFARLGSEDVWTFGSDAAGAAVSLQPDVHKFLVGVAYQIPVGR